VIINYSSKTLISKKEIATLTVILCLKHPPRDYTKFLYYSIVNYNYYHIPLIAMPLAPKKNETRRAPIRPILNSISYKTELSVLPLSIQPVVTPQPFDDALDLFIWDYFLKKMMIL